MKVFPLNLHQSVMVFENNSCFICVTDLTEGINLYGQINKTDKSPNRNICKAELF